VVRPAGPVCHLHRDLLRRRRRSGAEALAFLGQLEQVIEQRIAAGDGTSYTARLFAAGTRRIAQKVGEEGVEVALAGVCEDDAKLVAESADLLYHLAVMLKARAWPAPGREAGVRHQELAPGGPATPAARQLTPASTPRAPRRRGVRHSEQAIRPPVRAGCSEPIT
jgi:phosphoribosyl-ATP pyrophosphohydrolase